MKTRKWLFIVGVPIIVVTALVLVLQLNADDTCTGANCSLPTNQVGAASNPPQEVLIPDAAPEDAERVEVDLKVFAGGFSPTELEVRRGDTLVIQIRGTDGKRHGFAIEEYGIFKHIPVGETVFVEIEAKYEGTFEYYSHVPSNPNVGNIRGVLTVTPRN